MAIGRRCSLGCESWPDEALFTTCPQCGEPTQRMRNLHPLAADEAHNVLAHYEFEKFYVRYCRQRGQRVEGPLLDEPSPVG